MFILFAVISNYLFSIFPFIVTMMIYFDVKNGRVNFNVILYGCVKIVGGYIKLQNKKIVIHLSEKKAVILDISSFRPGGNLKSLKSIEVLEFNSAINLQLTPENCLIGGACGAIQSNLLPILKEYKDFIKLNNKIKISSDEDNSFLFTLTICFNMVVITKIIFNLIRSKNE